MQAIVSLLDRDHQRRVQDLGQDLAAALGPRDLYRTPWPHLAYHGAAAYEARLLQTTLARLARRTAPFAVRTTGLGVFTGTHPVVYLPVVRTTALSLFHAALWEALAGACQDRNPHFHPATWIPHITLAMGDLEPDRLASLVRVVSERDLDWTVTVGNLAVLQATTSGQDLMMHHVLGQRARRTTAHAENQPVPPEL